MDGSHLTIASPSSPNLYNNTTHNSSWSQELFDKETLTAFLEGYQWSHRTWISTETNEGRFRNKILLVSLRTTQ